MMPAGEGSPSERRDSLSPIITGELITDELDEMFDDHHRDSLSFVRDDDGTWYVLLGIDKGRYGETHWRRVLPSLHAVIDALHADYADTEQA